MADVWVGRVGDGPGTVGRRRGRVLLLGATMVVAALALLAVTTGPVGANVHRLDGFELEIRGPHGDDGVAFEGRTWSEVRATLEQVHADAGAAGQTPLARLPIAPDGMVEADVTDAKVWFSDPPAGESTQDNAPNYAMTFRGATDYMGAVEVLATARWASADDTAPVLHVVFRFEDVDLVDFEPGFVDVPVEFTEAWMAVTPSPDDPELRPYRFADDTDFFDDGIAGTDDTMPVVSTFMPVAQAIPPDSLPQEGVTFRAVVDQGGVVSEAARQLGLTGEARIDGEISFGPLITQCPADPTTGYQRCANGMVGQSKLTGYGVQLQARFPAAPTGGAQVLPDRVALDGGWTLDISYDTVLGRYRAELTGNAVVDVENADPMTMGGHVRFSRASTAGVTNAEVGFQAGSFTLFGADWLHVKDASLSLVFTVIQGGSGGGATTPPPADGKAAALVGEATVDWERITGVEGDEATAEVRIAAGYTGTSGTSGSSSKFGGAITLSVASSGSTASLAEIATRTDTQVPAGAPAFRIDNLGLTVGYQNMVGSGAGPGLVNPAILLTVTGQTELDLPSPPRPPRSGSPSGPAPTGDRVTLETDLLFGARIPVATSTGGSAPPADILVVVKASGESSEDLWLSQLTGAQVAEEVDIALPDAYLAVATADWDVLPEAQPPAVRAFVETREGMFKDRLLYREGVTIKADVPIEGALDSSLREIGVRTTGDLRLEGTLPIFGSESFSVGIKLPEIRVVNDPGETDPDGSTPEQIAGPIHSGTLELKFGRVLAQADSSHYLTEVRLQGSLKVGVLKEHLSACGTQDPPLYSESPDCYDLLDFAVGAAVEVDHKGAVTVLFDGSLKSDDGWDEPFGMDNLVLHGLRLKIMITVSPTSPTPTLELGLTGSVQVGPSTDPRDLTISVLLNWKVGTPVVVPVGFTLATDGMGVYDLVDIYNWGAEAGRTIDPTTLDVPDVRLEDVYLAYGTIADPTLCIRDGFFLAAELHIGGTNQGEVPACNQNGNLPPAELPPVDENCGASRSCVAAVLIDVQIGATISSAMSSKVIAEGYLAQTDLGPLRLDPTLVRLRLTPTEQQFTLKGGATLLNPVCWQTPSSCTPYELAAGDFLMDLQPTRMEVFGQVAFLDNGLEASLHAIAALDLNDPKIEKFDTSFSAPTLVALGKDLETGMEELGDQVDLLGPMLESAATAAGADLLQVIKDLGAEIERVGEAASDAVAGELIEAVEDTLAAVDDANEVLDELGVDPLDVSGLVELALNGEDFFIGLEVNRNDKGECDIHEEGGKCWAFEPFTISIDGLCDASSNATHALCTAGSPSKAVQVAVADEFVQRVESADSGVRSMAASASAASATSIDFGDRDSVDVLDTLHDEFDGEGSQITCGGTALDFDGGAIGPVTLGVQANGADATIDAPVDLTSAAPDQGILQSSVEAIVDDTSSATDCPDLPDSPPAPAIAVSLVDAHSATVSSIDEGGQVALTGTAAVVGTDGEAAPLETVTVDWGDGTTTASAEVDGDGSWSTGLHTYTDDGSYRIVVSSGEHVAETRVTVLNVAPTVSVDAPAQAVDEGSEATVAVTVTDPGVADTHTMVVRWGDGTRTSVGVSAFVEGRATVTHSWLDEGATGHDGAAAPLAAVRDVVVQVLDDDGGASTATDQVTVVNVGPAVTDLTITPTTHVENDSDVLVELTFSDPGMLDTHVVTVDWGPGWDEGTARVVPGPDGVVDVTADSHRTTEVVIAASGRDGPSAHDLRLRNRVGDDVDAPITVQVDDGDLGVDSDDVTVLVANVAPSHAIDRVGPVREGQAFTTVGGHTTWFAREDVSFTAQARGTDPGSDDLRFDWWQRTSFADTPAPLGDRIWYADAVDEVVDADPSPQVDASAATDGLRASLDQACLYGVGVDLVDDDGGSSPTDVVPVVVQRARADGDDDVRNVGAWAAAIKRGAVTQEQLDCYLDVAGHLSGVLLGASELDEEATPWVTAHGVVDVTTRDRRGLVPTVLSAGSGRGRDKLAGERGKLDGALLAAFLNLADGALAWDTQREPGTSVRRAIAEVEAVRLDPDSTIKELREARQRLWRLGLG